MGSQAIANLATAGTAGVYQPLVDAIPLAVFGVPCLVAAAILTWPYALDGSERRSVLVDLAVGTLGLIVVWALLVIPAQPPRESPVVAWIMAFGIAVEFGGVVMVLGLAAAARRRGICRSSRWSQGNWRCWSTPAPTSWRTSFRSAIGSLLRRGRRSAL